MTDHTALISSLEKATEGSRDVNPAQEAEARAAAAARGHKDTDRLIRTTEGLVPVWRFYVGSQHQGGGNVR